MTENFRPVSITSTFSRIFEKCIFLITFFRINNAVFKKDMVLNIDFW